MISTLPLYDRPCRSQTQRNGRKHARQNMSLYYGVKRMYKYLSVDRTMLVKLKKALYGLRQIPKILFDTTREFLVFNGFKQSKLNDCFFYKQYADATSIDIAIYVDDGFVTTSTLEKTVKVTMPKYATKIADSYETPERGNPLTPHSPTLFEIQESTKLNREEQESFHSTVMRIMFYAIRVRPDKLCTVNFIY